MDQQTTQAIKDLLEKNKQIAIVVGKNATLDEYAAALSLYLSLKKQDKEITIASPKQPLVEVSNLVGIDKVKNSLNGQGGDLIVSFPYAEGEIEKVSYTLENGYLNIVVKAGRTGMSFTEDDVVYKHGGGAVETLFIIGSARLSDLGNLFNTDELKNTTIVNIDNKTDNQGFGDIVMVSAKASSVSEQIGRLLLDLSFEIDTDIAQNLVSGIAFATDNFQMPSTTAQAFELTGSFIKLGAKRQSYQSAKTAPVSDLQDNPFLPIQQKPKFQQRYQQQNFPRQHTPMQAPGRGDQSGQKTHDFGRSTRFGQQNVQQFQQKQRPVSQPSSQGGPVSQQGGQQNQKSQQSDYDDEQDAPADWLTPKVYKGSTLV